MRGARGINILGNLVESGWIPSAAANYAAARLLGFESAESTTDPLRSMMLVANIRAGSAPVDLRVVHVVRDPRGVVSSFMNWKSQTLKRRVLHHIVPVWQPNPWLTGEMSPVRWLRMGKFEHFAWVWNYKNRVFASVAATTEYRRFRLEDLVSSDGDNGELDELARFVRVSIPPEMKRRGPERVNASAGSFPKWPSWSVKQAHILHEHCGELMHEYGYGNEPEWRALLAGSGGPR